MSNKNIGNVVIFGDSYSTYEGWIPEGYAVYYTQGGIVPDVSKTWWKQLLGMTGAGLTANNSWSGSTICTTGYNGIRQVPSAYVTRVQKHLRDGRYGDRSVDTALIFGGTNDCWAGAPLGEARYADWTEDDLAQVAPAVCFLLDYMAKHNPTVRTVMIVNCDMTDEITAILIDACRHYGVECVRLAQIDKRDGHPTAAGMAQIAEQVYAAL